MTHLHGIEPEISVKSLFDFFEAHDLRYEVVKNADAAALAKDLGVDYPWEPLVMGAPKYRGKCDGEQITVFLTIADNLAVWAVYGTSDDSALMHEVDPSFEMSDKAVRLK